ncbi:hypothetical protein E2562_019709 [Oryza meyeriana var. granulata]|uniref:Uncharacterized protein n=1 Tax=Oryza meyeriana var. granulata TaxID=110450 RepID=A0A6G1C8A9_9ORYZ|nr:hypothetical protein E2562_019709 [Oryza meyeriana var. granulata]
MATRWDGACGAGVSVAVRGGWENAVASVGLLGTAARCAGGSDCAARRWCGEMEANEWPRAICGVLR